MVQDFRERDERVVHVAYGTQIDDKRYMQELEFAYNHHNLDAPLQKGVL